jgi:hypothetical protein
MNSKPLQSAVRLPALLLILGGTFGIGLFLWLGYQSELSDWQFAALIALGIGIFVWSSIVGIRLWRGREGALTWARILYALQIPIFTINGAEYEYFTGFSTPLLHGPGGTNFTLSFGASMSLAFNPNANSTSYVVGGNLVAVVALFVLFLRTWPNNSLKSDAAEPRTLG